jgi:hypothetical protein
MSAASRFAPGRAGRAMVAFTSAGAAAVVLAHGAAPASPHPVASQVTLRLAPHAGGGEIPDHFVGLSVEWTLVERYLGPHARPAFAHLLRNLGTGVLRVGGSSQDLLRAVPSAGLADIRSTLDLANAGSVGPPSWSVILGTAMSPRNRDAGRLRRLVHRGVEPAFAGRAARDVAGIELGNEVDVSYANRPDRYLKDFADFSRLAAPYRIVGPSTSEVIAPWEQIDAHAVPTRFFWQWRRLLDAMAPALRTGGGAFASDHFYPVARGCAHDSYRCASVARLLSGERRANFRHQVYTHARIAAAHGLGYRVAELNSAANRGVHGVSDVAASALWALEAMFDAACPHPADDCGTGAIGVNFHNAEVGSFGAAAEGNAYYNPIRFDTSPAMSTPAAAPEYYALLLFARFAQGTRGLRPVSLPGTSRLAAWQVEATEGRRLFLINHSERPVTVAVVSSASSYEIDRMTPHAGGLDAREVRIDGRAVAPNGTWAGFRPVAARAPGGRLAVTVGPAETAVVTLHSPHAASVGA